MTETEAVIDDLDVAETRGCCGLTKQENPHCHQQRQAAGGGVTEDILQNGTNNRDVSDVTDEGRTEGRIQEQNGKLDAEDTDKISEREDKLRNRRERETETAANQETNETLLPDINTNVNEEGNMECEETNEKEGEIQQYEEETEIATVFSGEVRLRKNSIQERRKGKGSQGPLHNLRLPVHRSFSSPRLSPGRCSDNGPDSAKSEPINSPLRNSGSSGPKSPAMVMLSRVFNFQGLRSPSKMSPPCSPETSTHHSRKPSPSSESKKRRTLNLPLHHSPSPTTKTHDCNRFSFEWSSRSPSSTKSSPSPKSMSKDSHKNKNLSSPGSMINSRSRFYIPSPTGSNSSSSIDIGSYPCPDSPLDGTVEKMDGAGILYRPSKNRSAEILRNHRRTRSDTFKLLEANKAKAVVVRKRSRDDSECDTLPYDIRTDHGESEDKERADIYARGTI
nr:uncharacterized protein LOC128699235 [Cherax quadricarinatus]